MQPISRTGDSDWGNVPGAAGGPGVSPEVAAQEVLAENAATEAALKLTTLDPPPFIAPIVDASGRVSLAWVMWLMQLYQNRVGGSKAPNISDLETAQSLIPESEDRSRQAAARGGAELEMYLPPRDFTRDFRSVEEQLAYKSDISHSREFTREFRSVEEQLAYKSDISHSHNFTPINTPLFYGVTVEPTFVDNGNGTFTIGLGTYSLSMTVAGDLRPKPYILVGGTFTPTDGVANYLVADYNAGAPLVKLISNVDLIDERTVIPVYSIFRTGNVLNRLTWDTLGLGLPNKGHFFQVKTHRFTYWSGLGLSEAATMRVVIAAGRLFQGWVPEALAAFNSTTDLMERYYHVAGVWTKLAVTAYDNLSYDDGTNLQTLTANHYAVNWIYEVVSATSKHIYNVLGTGNYTLTQAQASTPLATPPPEISQQAVLVGRIIVKKGATTATQIDSAFSVDFTSSPSVDHNNTTGLQGGTTDEYYHLTAAEYTGTGTGVPARKVDPTFTGATSSKTVTDTAVVVNATMTVTTNINPAGASGAYPIGNYVTFTSLAACAQNLTAICSASQVTAMNRSTGTTAAWNGILVENFQAAASGAVTNLKCITVGSWGASSAGSTITNAYGIYVEALTVTGAITVAYGMKIGNIAGAASNYAIYTGSGLVRLGGEFGCNAATPRASAAVNAASTDLATVVALCNQLRAALVANGICV